MLRDFTRAVYLNLLWALVTADSLCIHLQELHNKLQYRQRAKYTKDYFPINYTVQVHYEDIYRTINVTRMATGFLDPGTQLLHHYCLKGRHLCFQVYNPLLTSEASEIVKPALTQDLVHRDAGLGCHWLKNQNGLMDENQWMMVTSLLTPSPPSSPTLLLAFFYEYVTWANHL
ncbi:interleukin-34 isoform X2 [Leucoraja erinacea]|uniref:interleukin-34 isoform X2 n=1 Tax=Leucoraja erinaceus TaxID=7782 RepID=UPI002454EB17|nr:interleukin-34 isoform X2 [Leucoraja erinacea]